MTYQNDNFYSETVEKELSFSEQQLLYTEYVKFLNQHVAECKAFIDSNPGIKNTIITFPFKVTKVHISGQVPWTEEQVKNFNNIVDDEKADMGKLDELLRKYPNKALTMLSSIIQNPNT